MNQVKAFMIGMMMLVLSSCSVVGEQIGEEIIDRAGGEGASATLVAMNETAVAVVEESAETTSQTNTDSTATPELTPTPSQNDANTGADAGDVSRPVTLEAGSYSGLLTGIMNGGDIFDAYKLTGAANEFVRLTVHNGSADSPLRVTFENSDGYDATVTVADSAELILGSTNPNTYQLTFQADDPSVDEVAYDFTLSIESENDAESGTDAPNAPGNALVIELGATISGTSLGNETGANDTDCYRVTVPEGGSVAFALASPNEQPFESSVNGELYRPDGGFATSDTAQYGFETTIEYGAASYESATAGDYTLCVSSYSVYSYGAYTLTATVNEAAE